MLMIYVHTHKQVQKTNPLNFRYGMHSNSVGAGQKNVSPGKGGSSNMEGPGFEYIGLRGYMQQLVGYKLFGRKICPVHEGRLAS